MSGYQWVELVLVCVAGEGYVTTTESHEGNLCGERTTLMEQSVDSRGGYMNPHM